MLCCKKFFPLGWAVQGNIFLLKLLKCFCSAKVGQISKAVMANILQPECPNCTQNHERASTQCACLELCTCTVGSGHSWLIVQAPREAGCSSEQSALVCSAYAQNSGHTHWTRMFWPSVYAQSSVHGHWEPTPSVSSAPIRVPVHGTPGIHIGPGTSELSVHAQSSEHLHCTQSMLVREGRIFHTYLGIAMTIWSIQGACDPLCTLRAAPNFCGKRCRGKCFWFHSKNRKCCFLVTEVWRCRWGCPVRDSNHKVNTKHPSLPSSNMIVPIVLLPLASPINTCSVPKVQVRLGEVGLQEPLF